MRGLRAAETSFPTAFIPEECPDEAEGIDDLIGIDFSALPVGGSFFSRLEFDRLAFDDNKCMGSLWLVEDTQSVLPVIAGDKLDFVQDGCFFFPVRVPITWTVSGDNLLFSFMDNLILTSDSCRYRIVCLDLGYFFKMRHRAFSITFSMRQHGGYSKKNFVGIMD
jgi:hypothetical protein